MHPLPSSQKPRVFEGYPGSSILKYMDSGLPSQSLVETGMTEGGDARGLYSLQGAIQLIISNVEGYQGHLCVCIAGHEGHLLA